MTVPNTGRSTQLDRVDRLILAHLVDHGRSSLSDLAEAVNASPSSAQRRLRRLEADGVIRGYRAVLDPAAIDRALVVHLSVVLVDHTAETVDRFERWIVDLDGVVSCHHVTGDVDYLLRIDVADVHALDVLLRRTLAQIPGVARFTTMVATSGLVDRYTAM
ncbi:Lrp/AsnC family transcriptional regulator [Actinomycetospora termitidis]|uniref:Lrp/AsnC family transcriptional regulator n=1 Tax=Actinomycetospora termitidis TaxID=3053470 RepID=A0ABT7MAS0_9PSEU|nr:Lrp/AsnC family transcriptional regulator [Actinomycetospora sp. Odt1-22]MDL5157761.1 Lrp/AsnC family transcriptional regulator [Actinomycetospora sp. Odt1-22]